MRTQCMARYRMVQLIDTALQPLSWPCAWYWHVAVPTLEVGNANLNPLASSLRGATPTPWAAQGLRIGSPTIVSHPAELQWLLARRAQPSQRCELSLLKISVDCSPQSVSKTPNYSRPKYQTRPKANSHVKD